ncbi:MAG: transcription termination factor NusA, partial [Planctomycetes bacterium]|nr:transcription termination factor NusA [Planctomycetota bacterium]
APTAKQVLIQRVLEAERDQVHEEYHGRRGEILTGTVQRMEGSEQSPNLIINIGGRVEAFFPRKEQIFDERFQIGDRVRAVLLDVRKQGQKVKLILSRAHPLFVRKLFAVEVPEIADRIIEIKAIEREAGYRSKVAVASYDAKVDCVGACVGQRGSRIRGIIDELNGEKIDIVRWNESPEILIQNALKPARISSITLDYDNRMARIVVPDDQLSLAIGKRGQNVRLGAKLCRWDFNIITEAQETDWRSRTIQRFKEVEGMTDEVAYKIFDAGFDCFADIHAAGPEPLMAISEIDVELAAKILQHAQENPDPAETIEDTVNAQGAFRGDDGNFLEPGAPRPGEFVLVEENEIPQTSAADAASAFHSLFGGGDAPAGEAQEASAVESVRKIRLGDIFAYEAEQM